MPKISYITCYRFGFLFILNMLVKKLRIYAILMRLQELEKERIEAINNRFRRQFDNPPITLTRMPIQEPLISLYDKNGKLFEPPKSKYHK